MNAIIGFIICGNFSNTKWSIKQCLVPQSRLKLCAQLSHHRPVFTRCAFWLLSQITATTAASAFICFKVVFQKNNLIIWTYDVHLFHQHECLFVTVCICVWVLPCVFILSVRETVAGRLRGGGGHFNGLLKEINGLQMAQSIYSNETQSSNEHWAKSYGWGRCALKHLRS